MQRGTTGEGYVYYRDRAKGNDATVYEQQLVALLEYDPHDVFDPDTETHHIVPVRCYNAPGNLEVLTVEEHAEVHEWADRRPLLADGGNR